MVLQFPSEELHVVQVVEGKFEAFDGHDGCLRSLEHAMQLAVGLEVESTLEEYDFFDFLCDLATEQQEIGIDLAIEPLLEVTTVGLYDVAKAREVDCTAYLERHVE